MTSNDHKVACYRCSLEVSKEKNKTDVLHEWDTLNSRTQFKKQTARDLNIRFSQRNLFPFLSSTRKSIVDITTLSGKGGNDVVAWDRNLLVVSNINWDNEV